MANIITNVNQACADLTNIKTAITDAGVTVASGTPSSEYASKIGEVYEAGKQAEYDMFWDSFQQSGKRTEYIGAFCGKGWNKEIFKPKYQIKPTSGSSGTYAMFQFFNGGATGENIVDFQEYVHLFDFSNITQASYMFKDAGFDNIDVDLSTATSLFQTFNASQFMLGQTTITLKVSDKTATYSDTFQYQNRLKNLTLKEGSVIVGTINLQWSPLTKESITSVINALSSSTTGKTATFKKSAKEAAFTADEWAELIASKTNWTFSLV